MDGLHRVVSGDVVQQLCPGGLDLLASINSTLGTSPAPIAFGKEIFLATTTATAKSTYSGFIPTSCGLQACKRKIMPGDFVSFACIALPETHIYSAFPFLPVSDFPSRNGLRICLFHGLISLMPSKVAFLEPSGEQQVVIVLWWLHHQNMDLHVLFQLLADLPPAGAGQTPPAGHEAAPPAPALQDTGLQVDGKIHHDADDSGVGCNKDSAESEDDMYNSPE